MGKILAFDFGTKRTGMAITDGQHQFAFPYKVVSGADLIPEMKRVMAEETIELFVMGDPKHRDGSESGPREALQNFVRYLEKEYPQIPLKWVDERFTSVMAQQTLRASGVGKKVRAQKEHVDQIAAVILLQSYLEQRAFGRRD